MNKILNYKEIAILFVLVLFFFNKIIFHPSTMIFPAYDLSIYSSWKIFLINSVFNLKEIPFWNPYLFGGSPFIASAQSALFYPFNLIYFLVHIYQGFGYMFILDFFLIGLFTFFYLTEIKLDKFSSLIGSIVMIFNGTVIMRIFYGHIFILDGMIWFPLLIYLYEKSFNAKMTYYLWISSLVLSLIFLSGNPQIFFYTLLIAAPYYFFRLLKQKKEIKNISVYKNFALFFISLIFPFCISAMQILPSLEFSRLSIRANGLSYAFSADFSLSPKQVISILFPNFFGTPIIPNTFWGPSDYSGSSIYLGILPLFLILFSFLHKKNWYIIFFLFTALFCILFSFGRYTPLYFLFYKLFPGFNNFRVPTRILYIFGFSASVIVAYGANFLFRSKKHSKKVLSLIILTVFSTILTILLFLFVNKVRFINFMVHHGYGINNNYNSIYALIKNDFLNFIFISAGSAFIFLFIYKKLLNENILKILIFSLIIFNLFSYSYNFYSAKDFFTVDKVPDEIEFISKDKNYFRIFDLTNQDALTSKLNIQSIMGYDAIYLSYYRDFVWLVGRHSDTPYESFFLFSSIDNFNPLRLLNTKYILSDKKITNSNLNLVYKKKYYVYKLNSTMPRAYFVPNAFIVNDQNKVFDLIKKGEINPQKTVILAEKPKIRLINGSVYKEIKINKYSPNSIVLEFKTDKPGFLVLSEIWYPEWKIFDNGKPKKIYRGNGIFRTIEITPGNHKISFTYDTSLFKKGLIISFLSFVIIVGLIVLAIKKQQT